MGFGPRGAPGGRALCGRQGKFGPPWPGRGDDAVVRGAFTGRIHHFRRAPRGLGRGILMIEEDELRGSLLS